MHDISAVIDALPTWFEDRVDLLRIGVMGHSRGAVTALAAAGGSTTWGFPAESRVTAIMGLAMGVHDITFGANVQDVTKPALLVAGTLDSTEPVSEEAFDMLASTEKRLVLIENANHRHFDSGLCAQMQSSGSIVGFPANPRAILDLQTIRSLVFAPPTQPSGRLAMGFCGFKAFTDPSDITRLVSSLTDPEFDVTGPDPTNVPTTGLDSTEVKDDVVELAMSFFERVFQR